MKKLFKVLNCKKYIIIAKMLTSFTIEVERSTVDVFEEVSLLFCELSTSLLLQFVSSSAALFLR